MRAKKITLAALVLAAGLSLTACQGDEDSNASGTGSGKDSGSSSSSSSSTAGAADGGDDSTAAEAGEGSGGGQITTGPCKTANLDFSTAHGMAEGDLIVSLKNKGGDACSLKGFPGVDLRSQDASGPLSAERSKLAAPAVALKSGETTRFTLHTPPNNSGGSGVYVSAIEVTPPNETHSKALSTDLRLPVGADGEVMVDPVGTGKQ
ncbi:DUF4232 domain-containing protein [Streptomyces sp. NPDC047525]|uniref:DUF4232 domain-containing protein n=1 Tax=Streptomyces sp. NPDC047525 TaxID=3155264 RepID=UPI0033DB8754